MRRLLPFALAVVLPAALEAQGFNGTWSLPTGNGGQLVLTLSQGRGGVTGSLSGNGTTLVFQGQAQRGELTGVASNGTAGLHLVARAQGQDLDIVLSEMDAGGRPIAAQSQRVTMTRVGQAATAAAPDSGQRRPGLLQRIGSALQDAARQQQQGGQANPNAQGVQGGQGAQQAPGPIASSPQDQQIAQLLTSSRWCYMRYSQAMGSTSTERVTFTPDGRFVIQTGRETSMNTTAGSYYGNSSGGERGQWRVQNGVLMMSANGFQWEQYPLRITQNSNGYPIVNANNKEYSQCN